jgi:ribosomal protein S18 acetylase RimI-like enzyme
MSLPAIDGYDVRRLSTADAADLQALYERCSDYHEQHEGVPTPAGAAEEELAALPPDTPADDKFALGIYAHDGRMAGYLEMVRDYPSAGEWQIGLLMIDPSLRGAGLGSRACRAALEWMAARGARNVTLGVLEHAPDAERFWRRMGFEEVRRQPYTSPSGRESRLIVMRQTLG